MLRSRVGRRILTGTLWLAASGAAAMLASEAASGATYPAGFSEQTLVSNLTQPTATAWTPDGRLLIAEKPGRLKVVAPGETTAATILDIRNRVHEFGDRGLLGLAVDSAFESNRYVYLLYTYETTPLNPDVNNPQVSRLGRFTLDPDNTISAETPLLGTYVSGPCPTASNALDCIPSEYDSHSIGTVVSAPDGTLYVGSGDGASYSSVDTRALRTYDEQSLAGKIVHIDRNGRGLASHSFCPSDADLTHVCTKLFAKGFRNPFRFTLRPGGGLAVGDVGWTQREEVDLIGSAGGGNYGWPCYEGTIRTPGYQDLAACSPEYAREGTSTADIRPDHDYGHVGDSAVIGGPEYVGGQYPSGYRNTIFFGDYAQGFIRRLVLNSGGSVQSVANFATGWSGVDLDLAPDGNVVYASFGTGAAGSGAIRKIVYTTGNRPPTAAASATPSAGGAPLTVQLSSAGSSDPDGDPLTYDWDLGDGTLHSTAANPVHVYATGGTYVARVTVSDGRGGSATAQVSITVGDDAPRPTIEAPLNGSTFRDGENVTLRGSATDPQDGALPASALSWHVVQHHGDHIHPKADFDGVAEASFPAGDDHDSDSYLEVTLTARDSAGLTATATSIIRPETTAFTLNSSPAGAPVSYAGGSFTTPFTNQSAIGFRTTISAAQQFTSGGRIWVFDRWSDGGARLHDVTVPATPTTLTATYVDAGPDPNTGLVAAYGFDEGSGTSVLDASGRGNGGLTRSTTWTTSGKYGSALSFNGQSSSVVVPDANSLDLTSGMTLEAWVRPSVVGDWRTVILKEAASDLAYALYGSAVSGSGSPAGSWIAADSIVTPSAVPANAWTHLATTYDGSTWRLYVNGTQVASRSYTRQIPTSAGVLSIGGNAVWGEWWNGLIDEVRVFDRARTAAEVASDRDTPIGASSPPPPTDGTAPTVSMSAPAANALVRGNVTVSANAGDNVGVAGVQFRLDGADLGAEDTSSPYSASWNTTTATNGTHTLTAIARDAAGNTATAVSTTVAVDNAPPTVSLSAPSPGATVSGNVTVSANAADNTAVAGVQFRLDGANLAAEDTTSPYSTTWNTTTATNGTHTLTAIARDSAGNTTTATTITVTVSNAPATDGTAPTVSMSAPAANALVRGNVTVSANAGDNVGVAGVQFRLDGADLGAEDTSSPYSASWDTTTATNGTHTLTAIARDAAGNTATAVSTTVAVDNAPPTVSLSAPSPGATVSGNVTVSANAADNTAVAGVQFRLDGANLAAEDTTSPYSTTWNTTTATNGTHTLTAIARDSAGNTTTATTITVTVSNATNATGPVAAYSFDAGTGTTAADASGSGNTGTLVGGPTWTAAGRNAGALNFDGVDDLVSVPDAASLDLTGAMTLEAWVRPTLVNDWRTVILKETSNDLAYALYAATVGATSPTPPGGYIANANLSGPSTLPANTWTHLAVTYDRTTWRLYVNGIQVTSRSYNRTIPTSARPMRIGGNGVWGEWFGGTIDDVRVYSRALTAAQVAADRDIGVAP